jgi:translation initiation factor IF-2
VIECFDLVDRVQTLESASDELGKKVDELKAAEDREKAAKALAAEQAAKERGEEPGDEDEGEDANAGGRNRGRGGKRQMQRGKQKAGSRR